MALNIFLVLLFAAFLCLGALFLVKAKLEPAALGLCLTVLVAALALRVPMLSHQTYDYQDFLAPWVQFFRQNGGFQAIRQPLGDYNVPYLYFLAAFSYLPIADLYLIKALSMVFDLLLAFTGGRLARRVFGGKYAYPAAFSILLLLPTVVLNGAYWGQCDSLYAALTLLAPVVCFVVRQAAEISPPLPVSGVLFRHHPPRPSAGQAAGRHSHRLFQPSRTIPRPPHPKRPFPLCPHSLRGGGGR